MKKFVGFAATAAILRIISGDAHAAAPNSLGMLSDNSAVIKIADDPPRASKTARTKRSATANTKGANQKGFCPPGQRKKPGRGSAFNC